VQAEDHTELAERAALRRLSRRDMLRGAGAGLLGASLAACGGNQSKSSSSSSGSTGTGGASTASGTPSFNIGQGASLSILTWNHFVPAYDTYFDTFAKDWGNQNNVKVSVDHIANSDLPTREAAEVAARKGHDIIQFNAQVRTRLYEKDLVDVSDIVNGLVKLYGDPIPMGKNLCQVSGAWRAVPEFWILVPPLVRTDLLKQAGVSSPKTLDDAKSFAAKMKAQGHPCGIAISHCNDSNHDLRQMMWAFGASIVGPDGKTLMLDTREMRDWLTWMQDFQKSANSPEVFAWQDISDNQYLDSGVACYIHDAISALRSIEPHNKPLYDSIDILPEFSGPKRTITMPDSDALAIWNFAPKGNIEAAKAFLWYYNTHQKENMTASTGYNMPFFSKQFEKPMPVIGTDPKFMSLQDYTGDIVQTYGYPGPPNPAAEEVLAQYILPDMVAKAVQGSVDDALKFGMGAIKPIYAKYA
jgi:ABC-type glycerol-3-phosphate transport system substrate-binding protein